MGECSGRANEQPSPLQQRDDWSLVIREHSGRTRCWAWTVTFRESVDSHGPGSGPPSCMVGVIGHALPGPEASIDARGGSWLEPRTVSSSEFVAARDWAKSRSRGALTSPLFLLHRVCCVMPGLLRGRCDRGGGDASPLLAGSPDLPGCR